MKNPLYDIPERLRKKILTVAETVMDNGAFDPRDRIGAAKLVLEAEKRNLDLMKLIMPKRVDINVRQVSTEELVKLVEEAREMIPQIIEQENQSGFTTERSITRSS